MIARATTWDGSELVLYRRGEDYEIRVDGLQLMSSSAHGSEDELAILGCSGLVGRHAPRILIGGLGMGYTLAAALKVLPDDAEVVVAEICGAVAEWHAGPLGRLAGRPLLDRRVELVAADVAQVVAEAKCRFDAILLDVDNGPAALSLPSNRHLYRAVGLGRFRRALRAAGVLAIWSADPDPSLVRRLRRGGFEVDVHTVAAVKDHQAPNHTIIVARRLACQQSDADGPAASA